MSLLNPKQISVELDNMGGWEFENSPANRVFWAVMGGAFRGPGCNFCLGDTWSHRRLGGPMPRGQIFSCSSGCIKKAPAGHATTHLAACHTPMGRQ